MFAFWEDRQRKDECSEHFEIVHQIAKIASKSVHEIVHILCSIYIYKSFYKDFAVVKLLNYAFLDLLQNVVVCVFIRMSFRHESKRVGERYIYRFVS